MLEAIQGKAGNRIERHIHQAFSVDLSCMVLALFV